MIVDDQLVALLLENGSESRADVSSRYRDQLYFCLGTANGVRSEAT